MSEEPSAGTTELVPVKSTVVTSQQIEDAGLAMPIADPATLRAGFAERQRVLTSILDPDRDFLYSIRYFDTEGKMRTLYATTLATAKDKAKHVQGEWSAHPKKSGVLKLAHALGIESRLVSVEGLPKDPKANYSSARYVATHKRTGRQEEGQGYCDKTEKGGRMENFAIISMADTRAYCHAVLRCAGYDNVGAEAMFDDSDVTTTVVIQNNVPPERERPTLASQSSARVIDMPAVPTTQAAPAQAAPATQAAPAQAVPTTQAAPATQAAATSDASAADVITPAMAQELSAMLLNKLGSKDKAKAWLMAEAKIERTIYVPMNMFSTLKRKLDAMETP